MVSTDDLSFSSEYRNYFYSFRIPQPRYPTFKLIPELAGDALGIAIVSFAINISIAKVFAKKYSYEIYPNQASALFISIN